MIRRDPQTASTESYDLIIVGGGIYGVALAMESARRNLHALLIERGDFGHATSWNSMRIIHGGFRYLQRMNLRRFRESAAEREWYLRRFPDFVRPMPCLMPLYGQGLRRPSVFRWALAANRLLSRQRNENVREDRRIPAGRVMPADETFEWFPAVDRTNLKASGLWYDAVMLHPERVLMEMLRWAVNCGATALNYVEVDSLLCEGRRSAGVEARDLVGGNMLRYRAPIVVNCAGPWCRDVARKFDRDIPSLFHRSMAFNLLLKRKPPVQAILAVTDWRRSGPTYFLLPCKGMTLAGTSHIGLKEDALEDSVQEDAVRRFVENLNRAAPGFNLSLSDIQRIYSGALPARKPETNALEIRPRICSHGTYGGPAGFYSVAGVKFTTARLVAEKTLSLIYADWGIPFPAPTADNQPMPARFVELDALSAFSRKDESAAAQYVQGLANEESVVYLDDLLFRRTDWGVHASRDDHIVKLIKRLWGSNDVSGRH